MTVCLHNLPLVIPLSCLHFEMNKKKERNMNLNSSKTQPLSLTTEHEKK